MCKPFCCSIAITLNTAVNEWMYIKRVHDDAVNLKSGLLIMNIITSAE